jgi:ACT domain
VPVSFLLRLVLPDRPGALGAVATALGTVGADILSIDVIQRSPGGSATDDFVVELPPDKLADSLVSAATTVDGVHVESIRPYHGQIDPHRELELLDKLGRNPQDPLAVLADGCARVFRAGWALVLAAPVGTRSAVLAAGGGAPELSTLPTPWWPPTPTRPLEPDESWAPADWGRLGTELAVTALGEHALLVGRSTLRWVPSELVRLQHLAAIAATVAPVQAEA